MVGWRWITGIVMGLVCTNVYADDTELYVSDVSVRAGARPQVLIIFDNSGSMDTEELTEQPFPRGSSNGTPAADSRIYYSFNSTSVPKPTSNQYFLQSTNGCFSSHQYLNQYGMYTGYIRHYNFVGQVGSWRPLPAGGGNTIAVLDCFEDIEEQDYRNATLQKSGLPVDGLGSTTKPQYYTAVSQSSTDASKEQAYVKALLTKFGTGEPVHLYTERYVQWYYSDKRNIWSNRLKIARRVIEDTIVTTAGVDFGLAMFNLNYRYEGDRDGGRIISGIQKMDTSNKQELLGLINQLPANTNTPLCETLFEAYRYFGGLEVVYGKADSSYSNWYSANRPPRDRSIEQGYNYRSPFKRCQNNAYIIYITDGAPTLDNAADNLIRNLSGISSKDAFVNYRPNFTSYLPALAGWMKNNDVNTHADAPGEQNVTTYTIGFSEGANDAAPVLLETAIRAGGQYYPASDAEELRVALKQVFSDIVGGNATFTSPAVTSNNFDRTKTFDSVYYAMFLPNSGPRWTGNIKKFKVQANGDIVDKNGLPVINTEGEIDSSACSFWTSDEVCQAASAGGDGADVMLGGALDAIRQIRWSERNLLSDIGNNEQVAPLTMTNLINRAGTEAKLAQFMGMEPVHLPDMFDWIEGRDVDDEDTDYQRDENRQGMLGDILHSKPLSLNYGTEKNPDIRLIFGTNQGFIHMLKDAGDSVSESWALMPYELLVNQGQLRMNNPVVCIQFMGWTERRCSC